MKKLIILVLGISLCQTGNSQVVTPRSMDSLDLMIGQMIMVGLGDFSKIDKKAASIKAAKQGKVGGLILFEKNLSDKESEKTLKEMVTYVQEQAKIPLFISIDEEGGKVSRLKSKYGFAPSKQPGYLGSFTTTDSTSFYAKRIASALYRLGINTNFAPSIDVNVNTKNPVIGSLGRSFSENADTVAMHAQAFLEAHRLYGVTATIKHFPGHGSSKNDSHLGLTDVSDTWKFKELMPYKALIDSGLVDMIMTAHIVNDVLDESKLPATLSPVVIKDVLRDLLGYQGVVVSDDMQMKAISEQYPLHEAIKRAILADVDILLFANNVPDYDLVSADQIHQIIRDLVDKKEVSPERIEQSYERIMGLKSKMGLIQTTKRPWSNQ